MSTSVKPTKKKVFIETLGCQMNLSDSELMMGLLEKEGFEQTKDKHESDLMIINTCQIRGSAEDKAYSYLGTWGKLKKQRPDLKIAMAGCVSQQAKEMIFKRAPYVDIVFGTQNIHELPELVRKAFDGKEQVLAVDRQKPRNTFDYLTDVAPRRESDISAWVTIIEGCDYFCTYCVVPYTRGRQISRPPESILREVLQLASAGFKEITLLGQTVDAYGKDFKDREYGLAELLHELNEIQGIERIRFMTSHPLDLNHKIIDAIATLPKVMEYIHIPMQSGNNEVLERMRRGYTREAYFALINKIFDKIPHAAVTGDFIVGFPGETKAQFLDSVNAVTQGNIDGANTAVYSPREQTPAGIWEQRGEEIAGEEKQRRLQVLNEAINEQVREKNQRYVEQEVEILVEGQSKRNSKRLTGRTRTNKVVNFDSLKTEDELMGKLIHVKITEATGWSLLGSHVQ